MGGDLYTGDWKQQMNSKQTKQAARRRHHSRTNRAIDGLMRLQQIIRSDASGHCSRACAIKVCGGMYLMM